MEVKKVLSLQNEYIKKLIKLKQKKYRDAYRLFIAEGERSVIDAINSDFKIESIVMSESYYEKNMRDFKSADAVVTPDAIFEKIADTKTPQGILAVVKMKEKNEDLSGRYIYCDMLQDPGNAGTIIRSADAFGFRGVIFSQGAVDVFSPKVIRSSMGSVFHIDIICDCNIDFLKDKQKKGFKVTVSALLGESVTSDKMSAQKDHIYVIGNEGAGVSDEILGIADEIVYIKMQGNAESLNAGVAASVLMYEVSRGE